MSALFRAFADVDQARPAHKWLVGFALFVGVMLVAMVPE
jgi:hypothetical protein